LRIVGHNTFSTAFDTGANARGDYGILAECHSEQTAIEAEFAQNGQGIRGALAGALVSRSDDTAGAWLDQAQSDRADLQRSDVIFGKWG
jgi:hypothetical protein